MRLQAILVQGYSLLRSSSGDLVGSSEVWF